MPTPKENLARFEPTFGLANAAHQRAIVDYMEELPPVQLPRKGRLYLLLPAEADPDLVARAYEEYYGNRSYDPFNSLLRTLAWVSAQLQDPAAPLAGLTIHDLDMHALGSSQSALLLVRNGQSESLFPGCRGPALALPPGDPLTAYGDHFPFCTRSRLYAGDHLVLTTPAVAQRASTQRIERTLRAMPASAAAALARTKRRAPSSPVVIVSLPGYTAVGALEPPAPRELPRPPRVNRPREQRFSSIWLALLVCLLAVGLTFLLRRPQVSLADLEIVVNRLLEPVTAIIEPPATGTPEPTVTGEEASS